MPGFTQVFGGTTIAPAQATFLLLTMSTDVDLAWPIEQAINGNVVADTIEVNATAPGLNVDLPDARQVSTGYTTLFNNTGANTVTIRDAVGGNLLSLVSGTAWVLYLSDNSTEAGTWRVFQLGASVSVAVAAALAGAGLRAITTTLNQDIPVTSFNVTPTTLLDGDRAKYMNWIGGLGTLNLPNAGTVGNGWYVQVRNSGSGDLTVTPPAGTIDGAATKTFAAGTSAVIVTDGTNFFTLGFGSGSGSGGSFDFIEINVAGSGNFTLSGANLNRISYRFIGILTGNRTIIVPNAVQQYWIANATTGAFSLFVRTAPQTPPGIEVLQNNQSIMYCDGTNVIDAESATVSFPIPIAQGGTGAVTAATARTNLGAGATGVSLFLSITQADAQTALGMGLALANTFTLNNTFTQSGTATPAISLSAAIPVQQWNETDAAADNRRWLVYPEGEAFNFSAVNDANTIETNWLTVNRTSTTIDTVNFPNGILQYGGVEVGYRDLPVISTAGNRTFLNTDRGRIIEYGGAGGHTLTVPAAGVIADGGIITVANSGTGGCSVAVTAGNLVWFNGSGALSTGTRTLAVGAWVTLRVFASGSTYITGTGIS